jgi:hypothetical protein
VGLHERACLTCGTTSGQRNRAFPRLPPPKGEGGRAKRGWVGATATISGVEATPPPDRCRFAPAVTLPLRGRDSDRVSNSQNHSVVALAHKPADGTRTARLRLAFEPICPPARLIGWEPSPAIGLRRNKGWQVRGFMHMQSGLWLDYDLGSLTVLMIGISAVALLALGGF